MAAPVQVVRYALRIVNNTPRLLRGPLPGSGAAALEVPPQSSLQSLDITAETARHLLNRGAVATRRGSALVFDLVVDTTP